MTIRTRALFLAGLMVAVSCSDAGNPVGPGERPVVPPASTLQALECSVELATREMRCTVPQPGTAAAVGSGNVTLGGQNLYVRLATTSVTTVEDTLQLNVTVQNLIPQALGADSVGGRHPDGVKVFFSAGPHQRPSNTGATLMNEDGDAMFFVGMRPYFQYDTILAQNETSAPRPWKIQFTPGSTSVYFTVYVNAQVRYPKGWIDINPDELLLDVDSAADLTARVRDYVGRNITETITWTSSAPGVASVAVLTDSTVRVTGEAKGTAWVRAVSNAEPVRRDSVLVTVDNTPTLAVDSIGAIGNVTMPVDSANGMLANDSDDGLLRVVADTVSTVKGGTAWLNADGSFQYLSAAGFAGRDSIHYQVRDGARTLAGLAVVDVEPSRYWYVRAGGTGDGRDRFPFGSVADAQAVAVAGDSLLVLSAGATALDGAAVLKPQQALLGQGIPASITRTVNGGTVVVLAAGDAPGLTRTSAGPAVTLAQDNTIRGVGITAAAGAAISGSGFGTLTTSNIGVNPAGPALHLTTGTVAADFDVLSSTGSGTQGLFLSGVAGTLTVTGGAISGATGTAVEIAGGDATITYPGNITNTAGRSASISGRTGGTLTLSGNIDDTGTGILAQSNTGGSIVFSGASKALTTGANAAVTLATNTGATISFSGNVLDIETTSGAGFSATGGGTVTVTGATNTIASTTGVALGLDGVSTGAAGLSFLSVSADGAPSGIVLANLTGAGVQVTGAGTTAGSGGTIQNTTGHAVSLATLAGADTVRLQYMSVGGGTGGNAGIFGSDFGTLRVLGLSVGTTGGPALSLSTGTLNGAFSSLGSANSGSSGVILSTVDGAFTAAAGSISNAVSTGFAVAGGTVSATYQGGISQGANNALLVAVSGGHTGTLTFDTGTLSATTGTGLSFNDADGAYAFNGTTTLNGGDAGIDVIGGSSGTFGFGAGTSITSPTGAALLVSASAPTLAYAGSISTGGAAGRPVQIEGTTGGTMTVSGPVTSTGRGILVQNNNTGSAKTITFSGAVNLSTGANEAVTLANNAGATIGFTSGATDLTTTTGNALSATGGGTVNVSGGGNDVSTATGSALLLNGVTLGTSGMSFATLNTGAAVAPVVLVNVGVTSGSSLTVSGGTIPSGSGTRLAVSGGTVNVNWAGTLQQATAATRLLSVSGGHGSGTLAFSGTLSATNGTGLEFNNADGTYSFTGTTTLNGGDAGIDILNGADGTFSFSSATSVANPTGTAFDVANSAPTITFAGPITHNSGRLVSLASTGGSASFSGALSANGAPATGISVTTSSANVTFSGASKSLSTQGNAAVTLTSNTGSVLFSGGGLAVTTTGGAGINATGGGTVQVTGANNTISSGTGTALNVQNTTIGLSGLSFASISHAGGAVGNGIVLDNTGALNGLQVTGTGNVAGSGGSITNTQGADGSTQGAGIYLNNTRAISLAFMALSGHANWAIRGNNVVGFTMNRTRITGTNGTSTATDDGSIYFTELTGTASITGSFIDGGFEDGVLVDNTTGTLNRIIFDGDTIGSSSGISGDGLRLEASGSAVLNATIQNTRFARAAGDMFQHNIIGNAQSDLVFQNNTLINGHPTISGGGGGVTITAAESGDLTYDINGNTIRGAKGTALLLNKPFGGLPGNGTMNGRIRNNVVGTPGGTQNGSSEGSGIQVGLLAQGNHTTLIQNNQVYDYANMGIFVNLGGTSQSVTGLTHNGTLNATVWGNTVAEPTAPAGGFAQNGLHLNAGSNSTGGNDAYQVCLDVGSGAVAANRNTLNGSGALGGEDIRLRQRFATTVRLPGYGGANNDNAAVQAYVLNRNNNPGTTTAVAANTVSTGGGGFVNTASCPQPS